ncbi:hypothetical protein BT93_H3145 [Corymbia citriodora subsp. variegata]|nr:hypothetical protein BT93_H3145 [Corymbia citriodora subsp. variegata]
MGLSWSKFSRHHHQSSPQPPPLEPPPQPPRRSQPPSYSRPPQPPVLPSGPPPPPPAQPYSPYPAPPHPAPYAPAPRPPIPIQFVPYGPQPPSSSRTYAPAPIGCYPHAPPQPQPHYSQFLGYYGNGGWGPGGPVRPVGAPPPYVDHKTRKKVKNDVNVHKDTIKLSLDERSSDSHLVSFTFDALVDGSITILYFAKEGDNCTFSPIYPEMYAPRKIPFQKGLAQKFCQPSGSGIDLGFFDVDELSKPSQNEDVFPLVICAETRVTSPVDEQPNRPSPATSSHAQITLAVLEKKDEGNFRVRVIKQILWIEGERYELREIYGISNAKDTAFEDTDPGKECVICMTEPKDTAVLPCRHMCMCSECAKELRLQSNKCPICRQLIEELLEIKVDKAPS